MKRLVIIPAFNEAASIERTVEDIIHNAPTFDYIVVNDRSYDDTEEILRRKKYNHINLPVNLGIGGAVQAGYLYALRYGYDLAIQVDGDGQHDAHFVTKMADTMENHGVDMLIGSRFLDNNGFQSTGARRIGIKFFTWLIKLLTGKKVTDPTSGMRMVDRKIIEIFAYDYPKDYPEPETCVEILRRGMKLEEIPVEMRERQGGQSSISFNRAIYYMFKVTMGCIFTAIGNKRVR